MRGAVSIALAYNQFTRLGHTHLSGNAIMITSTITVVLVSTVVFGMLTQPLIRVLLPPPTSRNILTCSTVSSDLYTLKSLMLPFLRTPQDSEYGGNSNDHNGVRPGSLHMLLNFPAYTVHHYWRRFNNAFMRPVFGGRGFVPFVPGSPAERSSENLPERS